jgi:CheY-like chemotaxis protein
MSRKILVIDDDADTVAFLTTLLQDHGYDTVSANDGREGLRMAKEHEPDLISLDLMMPDQSGTDFYRKIGKDKRLAAIPIIVVSGAAGRHLAVKKPTAIFEKPIDPEAFIAAIEDALPREP